MQYSQRPKRPLKAPQHSSRKRRKKRFPWWTVVVILLCIGLLAAAWVYAEGQMTQYERFNASRAVVAGDVFHSPVFIDDIQVTGMTMDEARELLSAPKEAQAQAFEVVLTAGDAQWRISSDDVPMQWNTESLLQKAYMIGRRGSLEQRVSEVKGITTPVMLYSEFTYDKSAVRTLTDGIAAGLTMAPQDAKVVAFDVANRTFAYNDDTSGQTVDAQKLYEDVIAALDGGQYGTTIAVEVTTVPAAVTRTTLEKNYTRIASFTTSTTKDSNRNNNINLAAHALNGKMIDAGGTISFNETTGQRLREKGYLEAGAIENGRTVQEVGGGVCQVSTTLFNALLRADCEIVSRKPHAWPSDYVNRGEDAAVDWPNLDLVMRNTSAAPMFITAWYENQTVTVEVYGLSLGEGVSIELYSDTTYSKAPTEVIETYNANLPVGTRQLLRKARTGYSVQTYKLWLHDGVEVRREKLYTSEYRMINEEYEYNYGQAPSGN